ncbi:hypothetical protein UFOVP569_14 [uncultured Caudovirales phage]|uniref:Uncharacterized protein n=1 Tax=uncultured Caudovirales phage TaxID=2100421 RepID=A0A6J5SIM6_9CAUD|nr:hypothetical protein UFOVP569_14 [uncultured Caudovirales phage]CAB4183171.1 hypothetical protein UFOVP1093_37 [uncultured Caudovirales phage]CAB4200266.1 hypothetical protein UFOVP1340_36 [uncultured Caudovirales phage]CAB4213542.1 hypothetical protein UFOVP1448_42 [uncultured Caudovirales phage]CAB4218403.1 hypothetical protein UFOVP1600_13 [uncultured Caudovirales phage]
MNTSTQDLAVTIGLIAGISKAFRFEATYPSAKVSTEADPYAVPEFTCQLLDMVDTTFAPARESYDFYFTDRENRDKGNLHIVLRSVESGIGRGYTLTVYDNPVTQSSHQAIEYVAFIMVRALLKDIEANVSMSWAGR